MSVHEFTTAVRERDLDAILDSMAPDVIYHSPVMARPLTGAGVTEIMEIFCEVVTAVDSLEEFGTTSTLVLVGQVTVGSTVGQATWVVQLNADGKVCELSWQARPFNMVVCLANSFAAGLAQRRGGVKPALVALGNPMNRLVAATIDRLSPMMTPPAGR